MKHLTLAGSLFMSLCAFARLGDKTLVTWAAPADAGQQGGSALTLETTGGVFDAVVFGELRKGVWMAGSERWNRSRKEQDGDAVEAAANPCAFVQIAIAYRGREITIYRNAQELVRYTAANDPATFGDETLALFGKRHQDAVTGGTFIGRIRDARVYDAALGAEELAALHPGKESARKPWAWWAFGASGTYERTGRFRACRLVGGARVENGALVLAKPGDSFLAAVDALPGATTGSQPAASAVWNGAMPVPGALLEGARRLRETYLADRTRPFYHFCAIDGNAMPGDSNGAFFANGRYHLMYLYERSTGYCWGHISSADLLHWRHHPDCLGVGDGDEGCYSGGGFVDDDGTAYLTYWMLWGARGIGMAKSLDARYDRWAKTSDCNPVIPATKWGYYMKDDTVFASADPSNIWKKDGKYYMLTGNLLLLNDFGRRTDSPEAYKGDHAYLFESDDLKTWRYRHEFYQRRADQTRATGWTDPSEDCMCAVFLPLPSRAEGGAMSGRHLLTAISHNMGCRYYIGTYRDDHFYPETHGRMTWVDSTYFAPEALIDGKGRQLLWTWLRDNPKNDFAQHGWSGVYGLARSLWLGPDGTLRISVPEEYESLRMNGRTWEGLSLAEGQARALDGFPGDCCEVEIAADAASADRLELRVCQSDDGAESAIISYDADAGELVMDTRTCRGGGWPACERAPFRLAAGETLKLRVFVDRAIVEVFANDRQAICRRAFTAAGGTKVTLGARGGAATATVHAWEIAPTNPY